MRYAIDTEQRTVQVDSEGRVQTFDLYSPESFAALSRLWLSVGWSLKYSYQFTWLGRPIIQMPEDMVRLQELVCQVKPDVIVETGVAHGGGQVFLASLCRLVGKGRVILFGFRPQYRGQSFATYPLLFNAIKTSGH